MKKKLLISVLTSVGIVVGGLGLAYAAESFKAIQQGFRQGGESQAARITMQVEAGTADANSDFLPDSSIGSPGPGGALDFVITNNSNFPIRVIKIEQATVPCGIGAQCLSASSNKNGDGTFQPPPASGNCAISLMVTPPSTFLNWPTIGPHSTLQVNGTDNNQLGAGMIHLRSDTLNGCQGALFAVGLNVTATEVTGESTSSGPLT